MRFDVVVVGGGTAGCILASRLSENPDRRVCLLEAGPDYGPLSSGRWPADMVDARWMPWTHGWGAGGEDQRTLGARIIGGCSAHNACVMVQGSPADYDEWGAEWSYGQLHPFLDRARATLRTAPQNSDHPGPIHVAFAEAASAAGFARLDDPDDPGQPVGIAQFPANVVDGKRWNAAFAYLDDARGRSNLEIHDQTLVDVVVIDGRRATGVVAADGSRFDAEVVVLAAGAYFTPSLLMRSGIGPEPDLARAGVPLVQPLPVGERLLDHCGTSVSWEPGDRLRDAIEQHDQESDLYETSTVLKAASASCVEGSWDLHLLSTIGRHPETGGYLVGVSFFHMKPLSTGRVRLRSPDPTHEPVVERGFLSRGEDVSTLLEALELARALAATTSLNEGLGTELRPGAIDPEEYVRTTVRNYFHPAGTCPLGDVVDTECRVLGLEGLVVADASIMPTIPRANTNLTTAAIAERVASLLG